MSDTTDPDLLERAVFSTAAFNETILDAIATDFAASLIQRTPTVTLSLETLRMIHDALSGTTALMKKLYLDNAPIKDEIDEFIKSLQSE